MNNLMRVLTLSVLVAVIIFSCKKSSDVSNPVTPNNPLPTLSSVSPTSVTAGDPSFTLVLNGTNFISGSTVKWNGTVLTSTYVSAVKLTAVVPEAFVASPGIASVTVVNPTPGGGTSGAVQFTISTISGTPTPFINSISPASTTAGAAAFTLTVSGNNFISSSTIDWNGAAIATTYVNATTLTATVATGLVSTAGTANVTVTSPTPGGGTSSALPFTISAVGNNPIPAIVSISPASTTAGAASFTLTATGSNFIASSTINWNGSPLTTTYINSTQLSATISTGLVSTAGTAQITITNPLPGGGTSGSQSFVINISGGGAKKFLFDATKAETAGNADWVIDEDGTSPQRIPTPAQSAITAGTSEGYWTGALSSFGIALAKKGHTVETLPSSGSITFGNSSNPQDLANYDVFVVDEPNTKFTTAEKTAILNFVHSGGGLFMVSDHTQSDRNNDGWDSPMIWNDLMTNNSVVNDPFGFSIDLTNITGTSTNVLSGNTSNPILHGSQGNVTQLNFSNGATLTLNSTANPSVQGLIWQSGYTQNSTHVMSASSVYGTGRVYVVTDSSPLDDGTGNPSDILYTSWPLYSHTQLFMNVSLWLAKLQ